MKEGRARRPGEEEIPREKEEGDGGTGGDACVWRMEL